MADYARLRDDGFEIVVDPPDTTGLVPVTHVRPALTATERYAGYNAQVTPTLVTLTWVVVAIPAEELNERALRSQAETGLAQLQAIIDRADFTSTAITLTGGTVTDLRNSVQAAMNTQRTQTQAALNVLLDALRTVARIQRRLIRLAIGRLDGTD